MSLRGEGANESLRPCSGGTPGLSNSVHTARFALFAGWKFCMLFAACLSVQHVPASRKLCFDWAQIGVFHKLN